MAQLGSNTLFYSARPKIELDGSRHSGLGDALISLLIEETTAGLARCEATFGNWGAVNGTTDYLFFKRDILDFGKAFAVRLGDGDTEAQVFDGRIMALEAHYPQNLPPEIVVLAEDRFQDLRMRRRSRTFEEITDEEVFRKIAAEHSLQTDLDINGPSYAVLAQVNQSDLAFLRERACAIDAEVWIEAGKLRAQTRSRREAGTFTMNYGRSLYELTLCADLACQQTKFTVSGWDVNAKEAIAHEATESILGSELNGDLSGSSVLQEALGERAQSLVHMMPLTSAEAQAVAEANFRQAARRFVSGHGCCEGDGRLRVGTHVTLKGIGEMLEGEYYVTEVRHIFNPASGYQCEFKVERAGIKQVQ